MCRSYVSGSIEDFLKRHVAMNISIFSMSTIRIVFSNIIISIIAVVPLPAISKNGTPFCADQHKHAFWNWPSSQAVPEDLSGLGV